uniref:Gag polyprotein n=1 Tax=Feline immunodeficiency virus TaxID=11673 RepID=A0A059UHZ3_9RETR|nr:gag protein [Feline immunodeficiency virus]
MGNNQGKELKAALKRACTVAIGEGKRSKHYNEGNLMWAIKFGNACTGRGPAEVPETLAEIRNFIHELQEKVIQFGGSKELDNCIKTLKVLTIAGVLKLPCQSTESAIKLYETMGLKGPASDRQSEKNEEEKPAEAYPIQVNNGVHQHVSFNPRTVAIWMEKARGGLGSEEAVLWFTAFSADLTATDMASLITAAPGCAADKKIIDDKLKELTAAYARDHPDGPRPLPYFTAEEIMGIGISQQIQSQPQYAPARSQARLWFLEALGHLQKIKAGEPKAVTLRQGPKENYKDFIDRLFQQIDQEQASDEVRDYLKQSLSISNANGECRKAMTHLRPESTLEEKLRACQDIGSTQYKMQMLAEAFNQMQVNQVQGRGMRGRGNNRGGRNGRGRGRGRNWGPLNCYNCGKPGHMASQCRQPIKCYKCGGSGHLAIDCLGGDNSKNGLNRGTAAPRQFQVQQNQNNSLYPSLKEIQTEPSAPPLMEI